MSSTRVHVPFVSQVVKSERGALSIFCSTSVGSALLLLCSCTTVSVSVPSFIYFNHVNSC